MSIRCLHTGYTHGALDIIETSSCLYFTCIQICLNPITPPPRYGYLVGQTGPLNRGIEIGLGKENLWIQNS